MILYVVTAETVAEEEEESWWTNLWRVLNEGNFSAEIGVSAAIVVIVLVIIVVIAVRCHGKRKRPSLPPVPRSRFFAEHDHLGFQSSSKSDGLYEAIADSSKSDLLTKDKQTTLTVPDDPKTLRVAQAATTTTTSSNSSTNEYSRDPTSLATSSGTSNGTESQNPTPAFPDGIVFDYEADRSKPRASDGSGPELARCCHEARPLNESRALTLDRPPKRKKRRTKQKSLDLHLSKTQADVCNFYLSMAISTDELHRRRPAIVGEECPSVYVSRDIVPVPVPVPVIIITTPEQENDLYLLENNS